MYNLWIFSLLIAGYVDLLMLSKYVDNNNNPGGDILVYVCNTLIYITNKSIPNKIFLYLEHVLWNL